MIDRDTRVRVARGIAKTETQAAMEVFQTLRQRGHPEGPPPTISDGWGGIDEAMIEVYGQVPPSQGIGRPPTRKRPQPGWQYVQAVKQREHGRIVGVELRVIFGDPLKTLELLGSSTATIERTHLTMRLFNGRLVRKTLAFSKQVAMYRASAAWEDLVYNLARPLKTLRLPVCGDAKRRWKQRSPGDGLWTDRSYLDC